MLTGFFCYVEIKSQQHTTSTITPQQKKDKKKEGRIMELHLDNTKTILDLNQGDIVTYKGRACMVVWLGSIGVMEDIALIALTGREAGQVIVNDFNYKEIAEGCSELLIKCENVVITSKEWAK